MKYMVLEKLKALEMVLFKIPWLKFQCKMSKKKIFLFYTPLHPNIGDQIIRSGEILFFKNFFPDYKIIEINERVWCKSTEKHIKKIIHPDNLIVVHGGGFLGDLWPVGDRDFKHIVESFPCNRLIILSQTTYYANTEAGKAHLESDRQFYKQYSNVTFFLRDYASYELMCDLVGKSHCHYFPDMALMINPEIKTEKKGVLLCIRNDHEKIHSSESFEHLKKMLEAIGISVQYTDTVISKGRLFRLSKRIRNNCINKKMREFAGVQLIISERLHGMIISAITRTPCMAIDNISKKISGVYEWLKHLDYVKVMNMDDITYETVNDMISKNNCHFDNNQIIEAFKKMAEVVESNMSK